MSDPTMHPFTLPPEQQAIQDKCFHPSGRFVEFPDEELETSIPARFEKIVRMDRGALPKPHQTRPNLKDSFIAPRSEEEKKIAKIWSEVLDIDSIGVHDNFFDLGGHSLAASRVVSRVVQAFQLELPVKALFESPTVAEMAKIITLESSENSESACARADVE